VLGRGERTGSVRKKVESPYPWPQRCGNPTMTVSHVEGCEHDNVSATSKKVLLAAPRGYCAGVERAVDAVERALTQHGAPVYVRKQIVHNLHVVRDLEAMGAVFVDELDEVP
jgi:4-hydroxy-3-methylbut-2-enyl diphosphate reductase